MLFSTAWCAGETINQERSTTETENFFKFNWLKAVNELAIYKTFRS